MQNWNGIEIYGYDYERIISYLETLDHEYLENLHSCKAAKGFCEFLWHDINKKHIKDNVGIDIPVCEGWPEGDYWGNESKFINELPMHQSNKDGEEFEIMMKELNGQSLNNAIDYWSMANNVKVDLENEEILKKLIELKLLIIKNM